jgi:GSH-dependent disulfide-bond oxidoreductase
VPFVLGPDAWERLPYVKRLLDEISARPAAQRTDALKTSHAFKAELDDVARDALFPRMPACAPESAGAAYTANSLLLQTPFAGLLIQVTSQRWFHC